jgi:hypothetical protein
VVVRVVERLRDEDPGMHLADPVVNNDHSFHIDRLRQDLLPELPCLLGPRLELLEIGILVAVDPGEVAVGQAPYVASVRSGFGHPHGIACACHRSNPFSAHRAGRAGAPTRRLPRGR